MGNVFFDAGCGCGIPVRIAPYLAARSTTGVDPHANLKIFSRIFMPGWSSLGMSPDTANTGLSDLSKIQSIQHSTDMGYKKILSFISNRQRQEKGM